MKQYVKLQIIKHALQYYVQRPEAPEKDIKKEKRLLDEVTNDVNRLKERHRIVSKR